MGGVQEDLMKCRIATFDPTVYRIVLTMVRNLNPEERWEFGWDNIVLNEIFAKFTKNVQT